MESPIAPPQHLAHTEPPDNPDPNEHLTSQLLLHATWVWLPLYGLSADLLSSAVFEADRKRLILLDAARPSTRIEIYIDHAVLIGYKHLVSGFVRDHGLTNEQACRWLDMTAPGGS